MSLYPRDDFCRDTELSHWTSELAERLPGHPRQFDSNSPLSSHGASRLYWLLEPGGHIRLDVYTPDPEQGYVVFLLCRGSEPEEIIAAEGNMDPVVEAFQRAIDGLPEGEHLASAEAAAGKHRGGIDDRQLIQFGQTLHQARTGSPLPSLHRGRRSKRR